MLNGEEKLQILQLVFLRSQDLHFNRHLRLCHVVHEHCM